jgi:protein CWC15
LTLTEGSEEDKQELDIDREEIETKQDRKVEKNIDADDTDDSEDESEDEDNDKDKSSDEDDDEEDETAELMRELERIKEEKEQQAKQEAEREAKKREEQLLKSNPLLNQAANPAVGTVTDFNIKKRWYDDTVFKNQSKEVKQQKRFINDTIRNDFHKKFLQRFVQ